MADFRSIDAAAESVRRLLQLRFSEEEPVAGSQTRAALVRTEDFDEEVPVVVIPPVLTIFLYRVDCSRAVRAAWSAVGSRDGVSHLPLDLHFLMTPWASDARLELRILGKAMQALEDTPVLSGPLLQPIGGFAPDEAVQICMEELSTEDIMRTFDSLPIDFKLSVPYVARTVRIDGRIDTADPAVTDLTTRATPDVSTARAAAQPSGDNGVGTGE